MNKKFRFLAILMMLLAAFVFTGCDGNAADALFDSGNGGDGPTPPPVPALPAGALSGEFSVGANKQVHFSKGNLWYGKVGSATTATFNFEDNQYSFAGSWDANHVSHFRWAANSGILADDVASAISTEISLSGGTSDVFFTNATTESANVDFTVNGVTGKYRTLSKDEWVYLFNTRDGAADKVGRGTVCGMNGIILLPDVFTDPMKNNGTGAFVPNTTGWTANVYAPDNWAAMEKAGAVFLLTAGYRLGSRVSDVGSHGRYWSATANASNSAYLLLFYDVNVNPALNGNRGVGFSVRLVVVEN